MTTKTDLRLIEAGFPCHQVGAETQRERGASSALPPLYFLHVWWARRPLTPSRAAVLASIAPAGMDAAEFVMQLGIQREQAIVAGTAWTLPEEVAARVQEIGGRKVLPVTPPVVRAFEAERVRRAANLELMAELLLNHPDLDGHPTFQRWRQECQPFAQVMLFEGTELPVQTVMGDPAWAKERIGFEKEYKIRERPVTPH